MNELNEMKWEWAGREINNFLCRNLKSKTFQWRQQLNQTHFIHQLIQRNSITFISFSFIDFIQFFWLNGIDGIKRYYNSIRFN